MLRMLGPHQGIRLERLRAELDDGFEFAEKLGSKSRENTKVPAPKEDAKTLPSISGQPDGLQAPPKKTQATSFDEKGYEWLNDGSGVDWYRVKDSGDEWEAFEN